MKKRVLINVRQWHINHGKANEVDSCPIALVLRGLFRTKEVDVSGADATVYKSTRTYEVDLPGRAANFVDAFDRGDPVKPLSFYLNFRYYDD